MGVAVKAMLRFVACVNRGTTTTKDFKLVIGCQLLKKNRLTSEKALPPSFLIMFHASVLGKV
jgi:hypothetical protein